MRPAGQRDPFMYVAGLRASLSQLSSFEVMVDWIENEKAKKRSKQTALFTHIP